MWCCTADLGRRRSDEWDAGDEFEHDSYPSEMVRSLEMRPMILSLGMCRVRYMYETSSTPLMVTRVEVSGYLDYL